MKNKNINKIIYGILSACAILVLCFVVSKNINFPLNTTNSVEIAKNNNIIQEENNVPEDKIVFNEGSLESFADYDAKWEDANLKEEFDFIDEIYMPNGLTLSRQGKVFSKKDFYTVDYSKVRQYHLIYSTESREDPNIVEIIFTKEQTILGCMMPNEEETPSSILNGKEVKLYKSQNMYDESKIDGYAFFEKDGYKFYINAHKINEEDFVNVVKSILK